MARLIDADELIEFLNTDMAEEACDDFEWRLIETVINKVNAMSAVEAEPVKHGKWTQTYASWSQNYDTSKNIRYRCSECNGIAVWDTKYCPYCGARMDGE